MRILLVHRHYHPDVTTYAQMLRYMAEHFVSRGHEVAIASGTPSYNKAAQAMKVQRSELCNGVRVRRFPLPRQDRRSLPLRVFSTLLFWIAVVTYGTVRRRRFDVVVVTTMPPVVMGLAGLVIKMVRGSKFIYHCMDIYPEIGLQSETLRESFVTKIARRADQLVGERASQVVVLSKDMYHSLQRRGQAVGNVSVINNFAIDEGSATRDTTLPGWPGKTRLIYAGNLGLFQGLEDLLTAIKDLPDYHLTFVGEGRAEESLREMAMTIAHDRVSFLPFQPVEDARELVRQADLAVVSLKRGVINYAYPSKLITYLRAGTPVLALVERDSELADLLISECLGLVAEPTATSIKSALAGLPSVASREQIRSAAEKYFGRQAVLRQWDHLLLDCREEQ